MFQDGVLIQAQFWCDTNELDEEESAEAAEVEQIFEDLLSMTITKDASVTRGLESNGVYRITYRVGE